MTVIDGKIEVMRDSQPQEFREAMKRLGDQAPLCMAARAGGEVTIPVKEIDNMTDMLVMTLSHDQQAFVFKIRRRQ